LQAGDLRVDNARFQASCNASNCNAAAHGTSPDDCNRSDLPPEISRTLM
jgi:hypothetical protein